MRSIVLIAFCAKIHKILDHIGVDLKAARIAPARVPLLGGVWCAEAGGGCGGEQERYSKPITTRIPRRSARYLFYLESVAATAHRDRAVSVGSRCCLL